MKDNKKPKLVFPSELNWMFYNEYLGGELLLKYAIQLNDKRYCIPDDKISYRKINSWSEKNLIPDNRPAGKGWRKFSYSEILWILTMRELRKIGFSLDKITKVKEALSRHEDTKGISEMPYLDFFALYALYTQSPISIYVFDDGDAVICHPSTMLLNKQFSCVPNYFEIDLNNLLKEVFPLKVLKPQYGNLIYCTDEELNILTKLKEHGLSELKIKLRDGLPVMIEKTVNSDFFKEMPITFDYGEFHGIVHNGKVTNFSTIEKEKFN